MQHQGTGRRQVVEHGGRLVKEQRQVVLDTGGCQAFAHVLVDAAARRVALHQLAPLVAEAGACCIVHREFASRQQAHFLYRVQAALAVRVKGTDAVDLVIKQIHPVRLLRAHRVQVDQAAAHRIFAGAHHLAHMGIAGHGQLTSQRRLVQLLAGLEMEGITGQKRGRAEPVERRAGRNQHHIGTVMAVVLADTPQRRQTLADQVLVRREAVIGQGFPVRKQDAAQCRIKKRQLIQQALGIRRIRGDDGHAAAVGLVARGQPGQQGGIGRRQRTWHGMALAGSEFGEFHGRDADKQQHPSAWAGRWAMTAF